MRKSVLVSCILLSSTMVWGANQEHIDAANTLAKYGYIVNHSGDEAKYKTDSTILRQEAIGIITKANGLAGDSSNYECQNRFSDVSQSDGWVCYTAETAAENNIVNGNNAKFRPKDTMTRYEAMILALKGTCIQPIDETSSENAQSQTLSRALTVGLIFDGNINLNTPIVRGEFFSYIVRSEAYVQENPEAADKNLPGCTGPKNGDLVSVDYTGTYDDGIEFDSSLWEDRTPLEFVIGSGSIIQGFEAGVRTMEVGETKMVHINTKDAYGEAYITQTVPREEYQEVTTSTVPANALTGTLEQTIPREQAEGLFEKIKIGEEKMVGEATLKITAISGDEVTIKIKDPLAPFYGKKLTVGAKTTAQDGSKITIKRIEGDNVEVEIKPDQTIISETETEITYRTKNPHPLAGKDLNFEITLISIEKPE